MNKNKIMVKYSPNYPGQNVFHSVIGYHWIIDNWCNSRVIADCGCGLCASEACEG